MEKLISHPQFKHALIIVITIIIALIVSKLLRMVLSRFLKISTTKLKIDHTQFNFLKNAVSFLVFLGALLFILYTIPKLKALSVTLFAGAGIMAAVALFASQQAFSNIVSGIFIVIFKPFRVNDLVDIGNLPKGRVEDITLRHTVIRNFENRRIIIPNSVLSSEIIVNSSIVDESVCNFIEVGISYDSDIDKALEIMRTAAVSHPNFVDNRSDEEKTSGQHPVTTRVMGFGDSSVNLRAYVWTADHSKGFVLKTDLNKTIKEEFDKQGIEIPFPYRTIVYKKDQ